MPLPRLPLLKITSPSIRRTTSRSCLQQYQSTYTMPSERILISGAGISGSILAYWLGKYDFQVTVVERSKSEQKQGQGLEIEEPALQVVKAMGVMDRLQEKKTGELGFNLVDEQGRSHAQFDVGGFSPTGALEMMRGDMTEIFYKAADVHPNVTYRFETTIRTLTQTQDKVTVDLEDRNTKTTTTEEFDLVVGADGQRSRTRQLIMGTPEEINCFKPVGAFVAYFSIPKEPSDWPNSKLCNFPNRRIIWIRPTGRDSKTTSACFIYCNTDLPNLRAANIAGDRQAQKEEWAKLYSNCGWQTQRIITQMMDADNFYSEELVQVHLPQWSTNRVVLLGDAAWAPTPFSGNGNQLAIIGAWVLAQELSRNRNVTAFEKYENRLRKYVETCQNIPLYGYAPFLFNPQTTMGIFVLRTLFSLVSWTIKAFSWVDLSKVLPEPKPEVSFGFDLEMDKEKIEEKSKQ